MAVVGVDIGGTNIRVGIFSRTGRPDEVVKVPLRAWGWPLPLDALSSMLNGQIAKWESTYGSVERIGFAVASVVDPATGYIHVAENVGWREFPFAREMSSRLGRPVFVDGDAACGAIAEERLGSGRDAQDFLYVVVGTGIGHALVLGGKVRHGARNSANVFGHIKVVANGAPCYCGGSGCVCQYASGPGLARLAAETLGRSDITAREIAESYAAGVPWAIDVVQQWMAWLTLPIANALNLLDLPLVVLGGGVIRPGFPNLEELGRQVRALLYPQITPVEFRRATLGEESVLIGAAQLVFNDSETTSVAAPLPWEMRHERD